MEPLARCLKSKTQAAESPPTWWSESSRRLQRQRRYPGPRPGRMQAPHGTAPRRNSCFKPGQSRHHISIGVSDPMTRDEAPSVMVVDDEPGIRTALRANFLRHGWQVETASCVRAAISTLEGREFDLVVTDIRMPDGTGLEVMRSARRSSPATAVILLTAYGSVPDAVSAMRDGALDYLTKPISFDQLQATAAQVMHRAKQAAVADASPCRRHHWPFSLVASCHTACARGSRHRRRRSHRSRERNRQRTAGAIHP